MYMSFIIWYRESVPISAASRLGLAICLTLSRKTFRGSAQAEDDDRPRVAIVGKPNVGKSSIINKLLGENRVIVSDIAGTTRDAIDTEILHNGKEYILLIRQDFAERIKSKKNWNATVLSVR